MQQIPLDSVTEIQAYKWQKTTSQTKIQIAIVITKHFNKIIAILNEKKW
jgi:hypothetical protein